MNPETLTAILTFFWAGCAHRPNHGSRGCTYRGCTGRNKKGSGSLLQLKDLFSNLLYRLFLQVFLPFPGIVSAPGSKLLINRTASSGPRAFTRASYPSLWIWAIVLLSVMVQLHQPAQRIIDPYEYIWDMFLHNPYHLIIRSQKDRTGFLRTCNMDGIHSHDPGLLYFFCPRQQDLHRSVPPRRV